MKIEAHTVIADFQREMFGKHTEEFDAHVWSRVKNALANKVPSTYGRVRHMDETDRTRAYSITVYTEDEVVSRDDQIDELKDEVDELKDEVEVFVLENEKLREVIAEQSRELHEAHRDYDLNIDEIESLKAALAASQAELESAKKALSRIKLMAQPY